MMASRRRRGLAAAKARVLVRSVSPSSGPEPDEQATLARIIHLTDSERLTRERSADVLNSEHRFTRSARPWSPQNLCKVRRSALRFQNGFLRAACRRT